MARKSKKHRLTIVHPRCAGIDIGSREHWVAVVPEHSEEPIRCFTSFTDDLHALADWLMGKTGTAILRSIVAGERDPQQLATLRDRRLRADEATVARSLHGNWREEHVFALTQALAHYDFLGEQISACDRMVNQALKRLPNLAEDTSKPVKLLRSKLRTNAQQNDLHQALHAAMGVDLCAIPTLGVDTVLVLAGEIGADLSRFSTEKQFYAWLALAPPTHISGGHHVRGRKPKVFNRAGQALRQAAANARRSESFIGASHRARLARMDTAKAIKATAHQLARLVYAMLTKGQPYVDKGMKAYKALSEDRQRRALQRKASKLGLTLTAAV